MAPSRTGTHDPGPSTPTPSTSAHPKPNPRRPKPPASPALPGVQKIKSQLRQTRRLLAKDTLAADLRATTERRLRSLEADLQAAERARQERALAVRYHKVKFFEKQKITRKIAQTKRKLGEGGLGAGERREAERVLGELRVDLNYVLHYPKLKKYVSLFAPGAEALRAEVRRGMESGEVSREPELGGGAREAGRGYGGLERGGGGGDAVGEEEEGDEFFGEDGEDE